MFVAIGLTTLAWQSPLPAQQSAGATKQQRDSIARADSLKRAAMAGMAGMKKPAPKKAARPKTDAAARKPATGARAKPKEEATANPDRAVPVGKEGALGAGMDSAHMKTMAGMKDTAKAGAHDSTSMKGMSGMRDSAAMKGMADSTAKPMPGMAPMLATDTVQMDQGRTMIPDPLGVPMDRMGSGTSWVPDAVTEPMLHYTVGQWSLMLHGVVFGQEDIQVGPRGTSQFGSINWGMAMATTELAGGRLQARAMLSADAATLGGSGYPELLQTGETFHGVALFDRQHPHDFLMELAMLYERPISSSVGISLYGGPSGEPALGPVAYMHRPSAMDMPVAPITHHWHDASHVSFGVLTAGLFGHRWKAEGSVFNGREPDENRWDIDPIKLDSYSGRLTLNPTANWSLSGSYGYIKSHDPLNPTQSMHRTAASVMHGTPIGADGQVASSLVWGVNKHPGQAMSNGVLAESEAILDTRNTLIARMEFVQKEAGDLAVDVPPLSFPSDHLFNVGNLSFGAIRELVAWQGATIGFGSMLTVNLVPSDLESTYGSRTPVGAMIFLRLRAIRKPGGMSGMGGMTGMGHE